MRLRGYGSRIGTKWVESRIHFQVAEKRRAFAIGSFESFDGPFFLADAEINHREKRCQEKSSASTGGRNPRVSQLV